MFDVSNISCPFDKADCSRKQIYLDELKTFAFRSPELVVPYRTNLFDMCPIKNEIERREICERFRKYCLENTHEQR